MIGRTRSETLGGSDLVRAWTVLQEALLAGFEVKVPQLRWRLSDIQAAPVAFNKIMQSVPESGLFFGFGYDPKNTSVLVHIENVYAQLMSQAAFGGEETIFSYDATEAVSRFDVLLFKEIIQPFYRQLHETLIARDNHPSSLALIAQGEAITPLPFELLEIENKWVKVTLNLTASLRPKEKDDSPKTSETPTDKPDADNTLSETERAAEKMQTEPEQNWPEALSVSLLLPESLYKASLSNRFAVEPKEEALSLEQGAMFWKSRVEKSHTSLRAVVENTQMTVAECTRLQIGQIIPLPGVSLQKVSVEAELTEGRIQIATGALGIHKTRRALKITDGIDPDFIFGADVLNETEPVPSE